MSDESPSQLSLFDNLTFSEGVDVEYKGALGGLPKDLWETYSAFANTDGGTIWLGITQRGGALDIHGVPDSDKIRSDFWNLVNNREKISVNLLRESDVTVEVKGERRVVRIVVPRADRRTRPVFVGKNPLTGTYRRNFEGDYLCTEAEVRRMFADQSEEPADSKILTGFTLGDLHPESLRQFRQLFSVAKPHVTWVAEDDQTLLGKLGGWRRDRSSGREGLTLAGLLMFGKIEAIRDPQAVPGYNLDYRERFELGTEVRWTDRISSDGTWEANLFQFYRQVMAKLSVGPGIKTPFQRDEEGYRRYATPVHEALQEALVNSLIHGDYSGQGGVVIDRYLDRIEFSNPGSLLVSREQLHRGGLSECRNKSLQLMFQMIGADDKAGSGIDKIRSAWLAQHWGSPVLTEHHRPDRVELTLPMLSTLPEETLAVLRERFGEFLDKLGPDEIQTLVTAEREGEVSNRQLQDMLTLHRADITRMLGDLVEGGFLDATGSGRGTRYRPVEIHINPLTGDPVRRLTSPVRPELPPLAPPVKEARLPSEEALLAIAQPIRTRQRAKPELLQSVVLALCATRFLTLQELARITDRTPKTVSEQAISPLVRAGQLSLLHPGAPNHPEQAYRATGASPQPGITA